MKAHGPNVQTVKSITLPAFKFALNTTFDSAIGCTPFKAEHGLQTITVAQARLQATRQATPAERGRDGEALEDVDAFLDQSIIKEQLELAVRMARSRTDHIRMAQKNDVREPKSIRTDGGGLRKIYHRTECLPL